MARAQNIKTSVEKKLTELLKRGAEPASKEELQTLTLAVKYLAVVAKLDEADYGKELGGLEDEEGDTE